MRVELSKIFNINIHDIVSIAGAGGKTTLMFNLAKELSGKGRVLVTTTTKIYLPEKSQYDDLILNKGFYRDGSTENNHISEKNKLYVYRRSDDKKSNNYKNGIYVYGDRVNEENKIMGIPDSDLRNILVDYDYILVEADGSKKKPLKGWRDDEPVISEFTNTTIGVVNGKALNLTIDEKNIHRIDRFLILTEGVVGDKIKVENILSLIFKPEGIFKNSRGKRILFISNIDNEGDFKCIEELLLEILKVNKRYRLLDKIVVGSLLKKEYQEINEKL